MKISSKHSFFVTLLTSAIGTTFLSSSAYAMDPPPEKVNAIKALPKRLEFKTMREAIDYAENLYDLALAQKFPEVLKEESREFNLPDQCSNIQLAVYLFNYCSAFSECHYEMGQKSSKTSEALSHYKKSLDYENSYLLDSKCGISYVAPHEEGNMMLNKQRTMAQNHAADTLTLWARLLLTPTPNIEAIRITNATLAQNGSHFSPIMNKAKANRKITQSERDNAASAILRSAILSREQAIDYAKKAQFSPDRINRIYESIVENMLSYSNLCNLEEKTTLRKTIKLILNELKEDSNYQLLTLNVSRFLEQQQELEASLAKKNEIP